MIIKYISSACLQIQTSDICILTDPWFTQGIYDGAWFSFPHIDPFDFINEPDYIYVSHIHPDHYDPEFIHKIFEKFGPKPILIPDFQKNYLFLKGKEDGLDLIPTRELHVGTTSIFIEENDMGSISDIDSALIVHDANCKKTILNLNDCLFNQPHAQKLNDIIQNFTSKLDLIAVGYTGAGPYPQTYFDIKNEKEILISKANEKKQKAFEQYKDYIKFFNAKYNLPFAGEYLLGGSNSKLNKYRGVSDAYEVSTFDPKAIIFNSGGSIDLVSGETFNLRTCKYSEFEINNRIKEISSAKMDYETHFMMEPEKINFMRLMKVASVNAQNKSEINEPYHFIFSITSKDKILHRFQFDCKKGLLSPMKIDEEINFKEYSEVIIDYRLMFGLLTGFYHWNNALVGSAYLTRRYPVDNFKRNVQSFLNFFTVA